MSLTRRTECSKDPTHCHWLVQKSNDYIRHLAHRNKIVLSTFFLPVVKIDHEEGKTDDQ